MVNILQHQPTPEITQAKLAVQELINKINYEILRRAGEHIDGETWRWLGHLHSVEMAYGT